MPSLDQLLESLTLLSPLPFLAGLVGTASLIALLAEWRLSLLALLGQYALIGLLLAQSILPQTGAIKGLIGGMVCTVLYLTARHLSRSVGFEVRGSGLSLRLPAVVLVGLGAYGLHASHPLPEVPWALSLAACWLTAMGLLIAALADGPFQVGLGILTFEGGFEVLYAALEDSLTVLGLMGIVNLLIALAVAYLAVMREGGAM
ncbi:MAG TPA: hypothetical protein EYP55_06825 [Anaerolineae bacterium]|nr:hypothetical protein [Anaerolineae bacterium]